MDDKQYLSYLTEDDVLELIDKLDYKVCNKYGDEIKESELKFEKQYNEDGKTFELFIKCKNKAEPKPMPYSAPLQDVYNLLQSKFFKTYNFDVIILYINDFSILELSIESDNKKDIQDIFAHFMLEKLDNISRKLGNEYVKDYNAFAIKRNQEKAEKRKAEEAEKSKSENNQNQEM
jgi:hypothetical protein